MRLPKAERFLTIVFFVTFVAISVSAQVRTSNCVAPADFTAWMNCRYDEIAAARISQRGNTQQVEMPSIADNTTSLVDQSSAPDLLGLALDLAGLNKGSDSGKTAMATTFSAYALYARGSNHEGLDPAFYTRHANLRRFSFTIGRDDGETKAGTNDPATILGGKILLINRREVTRRENLAELDKVSKRLNAATPDFNATASDVQDYIYNQLATKLNLPLPFTPASMVAFINGPLNVGNFAGTLALLDTKQLDQIDEIIVKRINSKVELVDESLKAFETIRRKPQLSFTFQSKLRTGTGIDEYQTGLTYDYGLYRRLNLTVNGTFNYRNSPAIGADTRGGKLAAEARFQLTPDKNILGGTGPFLFSMSSSAEWLTKTKPTYIGQAKFTIPIFSGIDFPISVSFSNKTDLIKESKVRGRFGFTLDLAKLLSAAH
jgi:hypothetical protein